MQIHSLYSLMLRVNKLQKKCSTLEEYGKTEGSVIQSSHIPFCILTHPGQYLVSFCVYILSISVTVYLYSVLRLHNRVHLYAE